MDDTQQSSIRNDEVLDLLTALVAKSLVLYEERDGEARYRLLDTVRQYARDRLLESGEAEVVRGRHRDWFLALSEVAEPNLGWGAEQVAWNDRLEREHDNLRAALEWSLAVASSGTEASERAAEAGLRLASALTWFWIRRGHLEEARQWMESALSAGRNAPAAVRGKALVSAAYAVSHVGDTARFTALGEESLALARETGDRWLLAESLRLAALQEMRFGETGKATSLHEQVLALSRELGDVGLVTWSLRELGAALQARGDIARARALYNESLGYCRQGENIGGVASLLGRLGDLAAAEGDYAQARTLYEERRVLFERIKIEREVIQSLYILAQLSLCQGDYALARAEAAEGLERSRELGDPVWTGRCLDRLGAAARLAGDPQRARSLHEEALSLYWKAEHWSSVAWAHAFLAQVALSQADDETTRAEFVESLTLFREARHGLGLAVCLEGLAVLSVRGGQFERAARLLGAAEALRGLLVPMAADERAWHEQAIAAIRPALGEEASAAIWAEGRAISPDQAISYAVEGSEAA